MITSFHTAANRHTLLLSIQQGDRRVLARTISRIENESQGYIELLQQLPAGPTAKVIGITGPPGAGKSTLTDLLIGQFIREKKKVAVLCVDPSSPFHFGALLGDRIRMSEWYNHPDVFIWSMATRGSLGGLHPKIIEITDLLKVAGFDYIIIETVGVGQSEVEIAGLADTVLVVLVPESGDEIQTMKAGLMEIADIFVVNKSDRPDAARFVKNIRDLVLPGLKDGKTVQVVQTIASQKKGINELAVMLMQPLPVNLERRSWLLAERAYLLIVQKRMQDINKEALLKSIRDGLARDDFNLYKLAASFW
jgi:LAO/AO transport system kinase